MKALINPDYGHQVQDVQPEEFPVVPPLYFVDCDETILAYCFNYNPETGDFIDTRPPPPPAPVDPANPEGPSVIAE
jgi:hypothetical protein